MANRRLVDIGPLLDELESLPVIDPEDLRPVAHWMQHKKDHASFDCSNCGTTVGPYIAGCTKYCPMCGAKMDGEEK